MPKILLIDDDIELCEMLAEYLASESFSVTSVHDGRSGLNEAQASHYDIIILDVMLPELNGFSVLKELHQLISTPVLMLTAKGDDIDRIIGLEMGADDYLAKPCNPRELVARLKAILRRTQTSSAKIAGVIKTGDVEIYPASRKALYQKLPLLLTSSEYNLLEVLANNAGYLVDKETLSEQALGKKLTAYDRSIDMHMSKLRQKLNDESQQLIKTVRGNCHGKGKGHGKSHF